MKETFTDTVLIVDYNSDLAADFAKLNYEWLNEYFEIEPHDQEMLDEPDKYIIDPGGKIFFAIVNNQIVGTVALISEGNGIYELAKMAVTKRFRSAGIGKILMKRALEFGMNTPTKQFYLQSNSKLKPAIHLYEKFGFVHKTICKDTPYERCDVRMELNF